MTQSGTLATATPLFAATLFISAALMFAIQPMAGKMLLPLVGGTPAGWIVALAFFQVMLLLGYLYAHLLSRFSPLVHGFLYIAALALGCLFLPVRFEPEISRGALASIDIFALLTKNLAIPFIALSATSSTLQRLFASTGHPSARDPYFLYAASNLGSFMGLLLYPLAFERLWGLTAQSLYWLSAYALLVGLAGLCLAVAGKNAQQHEADALQPAPPAGNSRRLGWVLLAFFPSALLGAVTTHISTDIFSAPMLWVLPLALYLLTFVVAFSRRVLLPLPRVAAIQPAAVLLGIGFLAMSHSSIRVSWPGVVAQLFAFGAVALMCHQYLAQLRPLEREKSRLTEFYLLIAVGGALGGILNAFLAPAMLNRLIEYPLLLLLSCAMNPAFRRPAPFAAKLFFGLAMACALMYVAYIRGEFDFFGDITDPASMAMARIFADIMLFSILLMLASSLRTAMLGGLIVLMLVEFVIPDQTVLTRRNFYGTIEVVDNQMSVDGSPHTARYFYHGTTTHGLQVRHPELETVPTTYFYRGGPVGDIFNIYNPGKVAVIGLGAGTMNCYSTPQNEFTFIEIDPAVVEVAGDPELFTFLSACKAKRPPRIIIGDGRLELARLDEEFDLIALDAFSSDTIPVHLLTTDAIKIYLDKLKPRGILIFNLSNRYFDLGSALARNAIEMGLGYRFVLDVPAADLPYAEASKWFAIARPSVSLSPLDMMGWHSAPPDRGLQPWTDDHTNLLSVMNAFNRPRALFAGRQPVEEKAENTEE